ncbi:MAG: response regulator [Chthoniobacteraceae bacterium]
MNQPIPIQKPETPPRKTILVVDDDDAVRAGLRCVLMTEKYIVLTAINGAQALTTLENHPCDLALIDMNMPFRNGWSTIAGMRTTAPGLPVIIITARPDQRTLARETGIELMEKPLDLPLLLQRIRQILETPQNAARPIPGASGAG